MSPPSSNPARTGAPFARAGAPPGVLQRADGMRLAALPAEFVRSFHFAIVDELGDAAQDALYRCGYEWALADMVALNQQLRTERQADIWQLDAKIVLDAWWAPLAETGWGACTIDLSQLARGLAFADVQHSIAAATLHGADQPVCHVYAGLLAGALSFIERTERHAAEVQCRALGHASCRFVIGPGAKIDAAETWRQQGANIAEIFRRLHAA